MDALPEGYPSAYESDAVLTDGATAFVRPIRPDDGERILAFHARQSSQSIYYRYFSPRPHLSERDVDHLTHIDYVDRMALVALRGDELIGVARYDRWRTRSEAEVAFFVDDANHRRGLATILLEHLAVRAREVGLSGFTASVLPENRKMIGVFTQVGFEAVTRFADGVVEVRLAIQPTPEAEAAIEERARSAASEAVRRLLCPRSVAVIGAGRDPLTVGHDVLQNLLSAGFQGPVWPVNPNAHHVAGIKAVSSILDIPEDVDLAIIAVPADKVASVVEDCGRKQVYGVVILTSGFAETGPEGAAIEAQVLRIARTWGIRVVGPNCLGIINTDPAVRLHATFAQVAPRQGTVSLLSESGMVGAAIVGRAREAGIGISSFVAMGNRSDVSGNDLLQYWATDASTDVVCMYIESLGNPRRFSRLARQLTRTKPVVAVKAGRSGVAAVVLSQTGVIGVPSVPAMLDTALLLVNQPLPQGRRVAVLGNAGGSLAIAVDAVLDGDLSVATLTPHEREALAALSGRAQGAEAVIDLGLRANGSDVQQAVEILTAAPGVDAVLMVYAPSLGGTADEVRAALDAASKATPDVPVVACFYGPHTVGGSVPLYRAVDAAALALGRVARYAEWLAEPDGTLPSLGAAAAVGVTERARSLLANGPIVLEHLDSLDILTTAGLDLLAGRVVESMDDAVVAAEDLGYPVVLKAAGRDQAAKTSAEGFAIDLEDADAVRNAWARMEASLGAALTPVLVQPMVGPGLDVAVRVTPSADVGPVLSISPGGAAAARDDVTDVHVLPLTDLDAVRFVAGSRLDALLTPEARTSLEALLLQVGVLVEALPELVGLDLNPVILRDGRAMVTQATVELAPVEVDPLPPLRRV